MFSREIYGCRIMNKLTVDVIKIAIPHKMPLPDPRRLEAGNGPEVVTTTGDAVPWSSTSIVATYVWRLCNPFPNFVNVAVTHPKEASLAQADSQNMVAGSSSYELWHVNW